MEELIKVLDSNLILISTEVVGDIIYKMPVLSSSFIKSSFPLYTRIPGSTYSKYENRYKTKESKDVLS